MDKIQEEAFNKLQPFQQRLVKEYDELKDRVSKLGAFMTPKNDIFRNLNCDEQKDMWTQFHAMVIYKMALYSRLERANLANIFFPITVDN